MFLTKIFQCVCDGKITYAQYAELVEECFHSDNIEPSAWSVYNYFVYENQKEWKKGKTAETLVSILKQDISFLSIDPKRLSVMVMQSKNDNAIKTILNQLFKRNRAGLWNSYDTTIAVAYLIQSSFQHIDLLNIVQTRCRKLYSYCEFSCQKSFLLQLDRANTIKWHRYLRVIRDDWQTLFLYFMYLCEQNKKNYLGAYAYYKTFFDRITADIAFRTGNEREYQKINYRAYYKEKALQNVYQEIPENKEIIHEANCKRNQNPLCHSSAELINENHSSIELQKVQEQLDGLINEYLMRHEMKEEEKMIKSLACS